MTAFFLLLAIGLFYVGGRIVLVHFINDTEKQVQAVGKGISKLAYRQADGVRTAACRVMARPAAETASAASLLSGFGEIFSIVAVYTAEGAMTEGVRWESTQEAPVPLQEKDLAEYATVIADWIAAMRTSPPSSLDLASSGIVRVGDRLHAVVFLLRAGKYMMFGMPFSTNTFLGRERGTLGGLEIRIGPSVRHGARRSSGRKIPASARRSSYGIAPMFSEAMEFYTGGFWKLRDDPLEAVFAIRDIAGNAVSSVTVSLPKTFAGATRLAILQLAFFVAFGGIVFALPLFWAQNRILLNPLTKMTRAILDMRTDGVECPRIDWEGKDEFAQLAESVNRMVEAIAAKTVSLANSEASHQALLDGVPDGLVVFDLQGRMVSITKQPEGVGPLPGFFPGELPAAAVFGVEPVAAFEAAVRETAQTGVASKVRLKKQRPIGMPRSVPTRHFELRLTRLGARFVLAIVRDVTAEVAEHKLRLAAEKRSLDTSKRESLTVLAAGIAHDMNNVLSVVLNAAEAEGADPSGDSSKTLETIRDAVRRGAGMMRELRTYAGENRISLHRIRSQAIFEDIRLLAEHLVGRNVLVSFAADKDAPDVDVDPNQFWKVFFNIFKNAAEAIGVDRPGHITVGCTRCEMTAEIAGRFLSEKPLPAGPGTLFTIRDDGPGIPAELLPRLFDPYVSSKSVGRGLGLATVRTIVEAHGGGIAVQSKVDEGTVFEFFLPETRLPAEEKGGARDEAASTEHSEVLVIDDEASILKTASILARSLGFVPYVAKDNAEALAVVRRHATTLRAIVLDADLGGTDTVRLLGAFRTSAPSVPVIVSTGSAEDAIRKLFAPQPYDGFLAKPYTLAEFKSALAASRRR